MRVAATGVFRRNLKGLSKHDAEDTIAALEQFVGNYKAKHLNFETVRNRAGYFTIRSNRKVRVLLRKVGEDDFEAVTVGNHDYIYATYFRK